MSWPAVITSVLWILTVSAAAWGGYLQGFENGKRVGRRRQWELGEKARERRDREKQAAVDAADAERQERRDQLGEGGSKWLETWR